MERRTWSDLRSRPWVFPAVCLAAGAWAGGRTGPDFGKFLLVAALLIATGWLFSRRTGAHLSLLAGVFALGVGLSSLERAAQFPPGLEGRALRFRGEVLRARADAGRAWAEVRIDEADGTAVTVAARLHGDELRRVSPGQRIEGVARLRAIEGPSNWGEPDFAEPLARRGVHLQGRLGPGSLIVLTAPASSGRWLSDRHRALVAAVAPLSPTPDAAALYLTLAAGLRAELDEELEEKFSRSGLAHLLSVSGLHVAVLALAVLWALRALLVRTGAWARRVDARRLAAPLALPLIWAYVAFTGNQAPAVRSALMATGVVTAMLLWRRADGLNGLAAAGFAMVAFAPSAVGDLSVQLSFIAVAALILLAPAVRVALPVSAPDPARPHYGWQKLGEAVLQTFCASVAVTALTLPWIAASFGQVSVAGVLSNVVALPLSGVLTLLSAGGAAVFALSASAAAPVLWLGARASQLMLFIVEVFAAMPGASVELPRPGRWTAIAFVLGLGLFALGRGRWRKAGWAAPAALVVWLVPPWSGLRDEVTVTFLSVGQGDAVVVSSRGAHALVDGGGTPRGGDPGERVVLPFLRAEGISALDLAVLSHPHPDHALGLSSVLRKVPARTVWIAAGTGDGALSREVVRAAGEARVTEVERGQAPLALGAARIEVLGPPVDRELLEGVNDRSVVLRIRHGEVTVLLPGDIEEAGEEALADALEPVTLLKAPHHGSRTSSGAPFVKGLRPRHVVFCVGRDNRFGFPHREVVERYEAVGAHCVRTDVHGAVRFTSDGRALRVQTFRAGSPARPVVAVAGEEVGPQLASDDSRGDRPSGARIATSPRAEAR